MAPPTKTTNLSLRVPRPAVCPQCGHPIVNGAFEVIASIAFCSSCGQSLRYATYNIPLRFHHPIIAEHCCTQAGISFWCPKSIPETRESQVLADVYDSLMSTRKIRESQESMCSPKP